MDPRSGPPLESLALDLEIGSSEGVSRDHAARIRVQYLVDQSALLARQTQFADTKATAVLALAGVAGARTAVSLGAGGLGVVELGLLALTVVAVTLCLMVLIPRYPTGAERAATIAAERYSWVALSDPSLTPDGYARFVRGAEIAQLIASMAHANVAMARVLAQKFRYLRAGFLVAIADVALAAAYYLGWVEAAARLSAG